MYEELSERLKRYEFNKTEPEVLVKLVEKSIEKGENAQKEQGTLRGISEKAYKIFEKHQLLSNVKSQDLHIENYSNRCIIGIDGSCQLVGGTAGKWFAPVSCARIILKEGLNSPPQVDAEADIEEIDERKYRNVNAETIRRMLEVETKALSKCAKENKNSIVMIDGPIVDPPWCKIEHYIELRCNAIKECIKNGIQIMGCVKRVRDDFLRKYLKEKTMLTDEEKILVNKFPADLHLVAYIFSYIRTQIITEDVLFTKKIEVSDFTDVYKLYHDKGISIFSIFIQPSLKSYILRLDIPISSSETETKINDEEVVKLIAAWTYPEHGLPLPVYLAHEKCEVRKGCADVLYEEILTKIRTTDPFNQIVAMNLR